MMTFVFPRIFFQILGDLSQCVQTHQVHLWRKKRKRELVDGLSSGLEIADQLIAQSIRCLVTKSAPEKKMTYPDFSCPLVCRSRTPGFLTCSSLSAACCSNRRVCFSAVLASYCPWSGWQKEESKRDL